MPSTLFDPSITTNVSVPGTSPPSSPSCFAASNTVSSRAVAGIDGSTRIAARRSRSSAGIPPLISPPSGRSPPAAPLCRPPPAGGNRPLKAADPAH
ncbi:MAG: hypothetical protein ACRDZO_14085 [Egibacteraceae bacterium]